MLEFQPDLQNFLSTATLDSCPRAILLKGDKGCGKKTFTKALGSNLSLQIKDITQALTEDALETISEVRGAANPFLYIINADDLSIKDQNALLRLIENPPKGCIFVLHSSTFILPTLINRCRQLTFREYSKADLKTLCPNASDLLIEICHTPGQLFDYLDTDLTTYQALVENMFNNFAKASISNILTISNKFKWTKSDDDSKMNFDLFLLLLLKKAALSAKHNSACLPLYKNVQQLYRDSTLPNIDRRRAFDRFLVVAKEGGYVWF